MIKRISLFSAFVLILILSFPFSVSAASVSYFDGTSTFGIARRMEGQAVDFSYVNQQFTTPLFSTMGIVDATSFGIPSMGYQYSSIPCFYSYTSADAILGGGLLYFGFCFCYRDQSSCTNVRFSYPDTLTCRLFTNGSFERSQASPITLTAHKVSSAGMANSVIINSPDNGYNPAYPYRIGNVTLPNGLNTPTQVYYGFDDGDSYGFANAQFLSYSDTSLNWGKSNIYLYSVDLSEIDIDKWNIRGFYNTLWVDLSSLVSGTFRTETKRADILLNENHVDYSNCSVAPTFYLCPITSFSCDKSYQSFADQLFSEFATVDSYLSAIDAYAFISKNHLSDILDLLEDYLGPGGSSASIASAVDDSVQSDKAKLDYLSQSMQAPSVSIDNLDTDILGMFNTDGFTALGGFIGNIFSESHFSIILSCMFIISIISYIFFGKK